MHPGKFLVADLTPRSEHVEHDGNASCSLECLEEAPKARIPITRDRLQPPGAVDVCGRGNLIALFRADGIGHGHER